MILFSFSERSLLIAVFSKRKRDFQRKNGLGLL